MNSPINLDNLRPGFRDPVRDSQVVFRTVLDCFANPGKCQSVTPDLQPPPGMDVATAAISLTLFDHETSVWFDIDEQGEIAGWLRFHCQCPITESREQADFAIVTKPRLMTDLDHFRIGEPERPDRSTTLILQTDGLEQGTCYTLTGPGIEKSAEFRPVGIPQAIWDSRERLYPLFPLGIDMILTSEEKLMSLPRTTEMGGA